MNTSQDAGTALQPVAIAAAAATFLTGVLFAVQESVPGWEQMTFAALNGLPGTIFAPVWLAMQAGAAFAIPVVAALALHLRRRALAVRLVVSGGVAYVLAVIVKMLVERARPEGLLDAVIIRGDPQTGLGFISGHATIAAALATVASAHLGRGGRIVVWSLAALVAFGRVYVGAHMPLDVVGGAAVGVLIGLLVLRFTEARGAIRIPVRTRR